METFLLALHVLAGILFVGPVAVAASLFPRYVPVTVTVSPSPKTLASGDAGARVRRMSEVDPRSMSVARVLNRITTAYGKLALAVPVIGIALALLQGRGGEVWIVIAMLLTALAGALLAFRVAPMQARLLANPDAGAGLRQLGMITGIFNLLWAIVVVLMVVRPGAMGT